MAARKRTTKANLSSSRNVIKIDSHPRFKRVAESEKPTDEEIEEIFQMAIEGRLRFEVAPLSDEEGTS